MTKLLITVPKDSAIAQFLYQQPLVYRVIDLTSTSVVFSYGGVIPPLAKISLFLSFYEPSEYTIDKSTTGFSFIVRSF